MTMKYRVMASLALAGLATTAGAQEKTLRIVIPQEPPNLEICDTGSNAPARVLFGNVSEGLTERDPNGGDLKPLLANSWEQTSPTTWVFSLRKGVKFHDGSPFNAETASASIARSFDPDLACDTVSGVFGAALLTGKALGEYQLEITTSLPDPILPVRISFLGMTGPNSSLDAKTSEPIGTGPYKLASYERGAQIVLAANPDYWGTPGDASQVTYIIRPDDLVRSQMIGAGEADIAVGLPMEFASMDGAVAFPVPETTGLRINLGSPPYDDHRVRQAVLHAIDREGLIAAVWNGGAVPAAQPITADVLGFDPNVVVPEYNPDLAKSLIDEARNDGVAVDTPSKIYTRVDIVDNADLLSQALAQQLTAVGLNVEVEIMEAAPWIERLLSHGTDSPGFILEPHNNGLGDASWTANAKYHSSQSRSQMRGDFAVKADAMIEAAGQAQGEERRRLYQDFFKYLDQDVIADAFIAHTQAVMVIAPRVTYTPNAMSNDVLRVTEVKLAD
jgi:peptide/nickel transport system substrate-binding protein